MHTLVCRDAHIVLAFHAFLRGAHDHGLEGLLHGLVNLAVQHGEGLLDSRFVAKVHIRSVDEHLNFHNFSVNLVVHCLLFVLLHHGLHSGLLTLIVVLQNVAFGCGDFGHYLVLGMSYSKILLLTEKVFLGAVVLS